MRMKNGFTLIELMIVVSIIAIISSISIPNLLRARLNANEGAAVGGLEALAAAQISHNTTHGEFGDFAALTGDDPPHINGNWFDGCVNNGYVYTMPIVTPSYFEIYAEPVAPGRSGERFFRIDASGALRYNTGAPPDETSEVVGTSW